MAEFCGSTAPNELPIGTMISGYEVVSVLGKGGFGVVYKVKFKQTERFFALKTEYIDAEKHALQNELAFSRAVSSPFFPHIYTQGTEGGIRYAVMDLFGKSIAQLRNESQSRTIPPRYLLKFGAEMVRCIQQLHAFGYVHMDVKPSNFLMSKAAGFPLVLIDFGLAREYIDRGTGEPFPEATRRRFCGTSRYASPRVHEGRSPAPADDLFSWFYSVVELWRGRLPWAGAESGGAVYAMKKAAGDELCAQMPAKFREIYSYISGIGYCDAVDYDGIIRGLDDVYGAMFPGVKTDLTDFFYEVHAGEKRPGESGSAPRVRILRDGNEKATCRI